MNKELWKFAALSGFLVLMAAAIWVYRPVENRLTRVKIMHSTKCDVFSVRRPRNILIKDRGLAVYKLGGSKKKDKNCELEHMRSPFAVSYA